MEHDLSAPLTVEQMYEDWGIEWEDAVDLADASLDPRPRSSIYDTVAACGIGPASRVLDIGGRDGAQALDLAERFGCRMLSVDPVEDNVELGKADIAAHPSGHLVDITVGTIEDIPAEDETFDLVFSRDMLGHVERLDAALIECRRVMVPGAAMVIHDVFATPLLDPAEAASLSADLAQVPERLDLALFERTVAEAGFTIDEIDVVGSEWLEATLESDDAERRLLRVARMRRDRDRLIESMGVVPYRVVLANTLWTIYRMIGKLEDRVYVIRV